MSDKKTVIKKVNELTEGVWQQAEDGSWIRLGDDYFVGQSTATPIPPVVVPEEVQHEEAPEQPPLPLETPDTGIAPSTIPWVETAVKLLGTKEVPGSRSNKVIMSWADDIGGWVDGYYKNDGIPWCGLFVGHLMAANKIKITIKNLLSARAWGKFGFEVEPCYGAIMVFSRSGGGHVGLYVSEDSKYYHILGGNQSDSVNVTKIAKSRFLSARWPTGYENLHQMYKGRIVKSFDGEVSYNEA